MENESIPGTIKEIERINEDMQLILYSPDIWVLHANILRYVVFQYVTPQLLENLKPSVLPLAHTG